MRIKIVVFKNLETKDKIDYSILCSPGLLDFLSSSTTRYGELIKLSGDSFYCFVSYNTEGSVFKKSGDFQLLPLSRPCPPAARTTQPAPVSNHKHEGHGGLDRALRAGPTDY